MLLFLSPFFIFSLFLPQHSPLLLILCLRFVLPMLHLYLQMIHILNLFLLLMVFPLIMLMILPFRFLKIIFLIFQNPDPIPPSLPNPSFVPSLRRSTKVSKPPAYLQPYKCNTLSIRYPIGNFVSSHQLSPSYFHFYNSISALKEPQFYHQAVGDPNWEVAMVVELEALEQNHTWSIVPLPPNKKVVGCKWVFRIVRNL